MAMAMTVENLRGCPRCGLVHRLPPLPPRHRARCTRCGDVIRQTDAAMPNRLCAAVAAAALICYPLGILLPVMTLRELGHVTETSIWAGTVSLLEHGQWLVGLVVLVCSIVVPLIKLGGLFVLCARPAWLGRGHKAALYRAIEMAGRWGMIDVLLVALVVAASRAARVAVRSASALFNPHAIWETK